MAEVSGVPVFSVFPAKVLSWSEVTADRRRGWEQLRRCGGFEAHKGWVRFHPHPPKHTKQYREVPEWEERGLFEVRD